MATDMGIIMRAQRIIWVPAFLALSGVLLTWGGGGQRPAEAKTAMVCTIFEDWKEHDPLWFVFWAADDHYHRHESANEHPGPSWEHVQDVRATGYAHTAMLEKYTMDSGEHGFCHDDGEEH